MERMGVRNAIVTNEDSATLAEHFPCFFHGIMVDAPCSGEGMFRKEQIAIDEWSQENVNKCAVRQAEILENAVKCLANGGHIIYATCTFSLEENEMTVDNFLKSHPDFEIIPTTDRVQAATENGINFSGCECQNMHYARRFYPHKNRGEGQFMAVLHHKGEKSDSVCNRKKSDSKINPVLTEFLDGDTPVFFSGDIEISRGNAFMCGVTIGEIKKNYVLPHHQFFMAYGNDFKRKIELSPDSQDLIRYLHGEEITAECENGWAAVTVCGAKVVNKTAKNHYPKGLRIK